VEAAMACGRSRAFLEKWTVAGPVWARNFPQSHFTATPVKLGGPDFTNPRIALARANRRSHTRRDGMLDQLVHNAHRIEMKGDFDGQESWKAEWIVVTPARQSGAGCSE
jgi:hypothetical protein